MFRPRDYHYALPPELIAQEATAVRDASRLLHVGPSSLEDRAFTDIVDLLPADAVLVVNDTRVVPARLETRKPTGGAIELFFLEPLAPDRWRCLARGTVKPGMVLTAEGGAEFIVIGERDDAGLVEIAAPVDLVAYLDQYGHVPLPPYIDRPDRPDDRTRYQTMFAREPGAVASPTAGLHMTPAIADRLAARGVSIAPLTLHVGLGTFEPIRVDDIREHHMHAERFTIPESTHALVRSGRPVVALGTTALRALESDPAKPSTEIFIYPGSNHTFHVDHLITNFHLPESTLLMLVCAFAGTDRVVAAYRHAVQKRYRFYSYGDAMLVHRS